MKILKKLLLLTALLPFTNSYGAEEITVRGSDGKMYRYTNLDPRFFEKQRVFAMTSKEGYFLTAEGAKIYFKNSDGSDIVKNGYVNLGRYFMISSQPFTTYTYVITPNYSSNSNSYSNSSERKNLSNNHSAPSISSDFWPKGLVSYKLDPEFTENEKSIIKNALNDLETKVNADVPSSNGSDIIQKRLSFNDLDTSGSVLISLDCVKTNSCSNTNPSTWKPKQL